LAAEPTTSRRTTGIQAAREVRLTDDELAAVSLTKRARQVYPALHSFARRDLTWPLPGDVAKHLGVSTDTVQRAIGDLIAAGLLEWTGLRNGKARVYRFLPLDVGSPQAAVESPQLAAQEPTAEGPFKGTPAAVRADAAQRGASSGRGVSPWQEEDRAWHNEFEWTPELLDEYAARARAVWERLAFDEERPKLDQVAAGTCGDCRLEASRRERFGKFELCVSCVARRHAVAMKLASQVTIAETLP